MNTAGAAERAWELEIGGARFPVGPEALLLGRDPECDVPLLDDRVSWHHLKIDLVDGSPRLTDLGSSNGTMLDGDELRGAARAISRETVIQIGSTRARIRDKATGPSSARGRFRRIAIPRRPLSIGRAPDNDVVLDEPNVSWHHAEIRPGNPPTIRDLGARNGVRFGPQLIRGEVGLPDGAAAGIGPFSLRCEQGELVLVDEREGGLTLAAEQVGVQIGSLTILHQTSLKVTSGEFVAMIGPSGSGKTTLLKCLAGVTDPSSGRVVVGADPLEVRRTEVGYVPQSDVVHDRLTVREALLYAARLRLPSDTRRPEHHAAIDFVLAELRLDDRQDTYVGRLSGGQRKRVACGVELIGKPMMLLLDEPTSGLDPALERRLMMTLRGLADSGRGIVVVTHATSSLSLCDTVVVMGPGGFVLFAGSPAESLEHFHVAAYDEIYNAIDLASVPAPVPAASGATTARIRQRLLSGRSLPGHTAVLTARYARTLLRDRRTLAILLGQAPIIALLIALLYPAHVLALPDRQPTRSAQFVFLLVTAALWLGLVDSCREVVKERSIVLRELAVGVRLDAYMLAKACLLFVLAAAQCALLVAVAALVQPLHASAGAYGALFGLLVLTSWSTVAMGLVVSTVARSVDQATSLIPLLLIPQLLFGAALLPFAKMSGPVKALADLMVSRWAYAGTGNTIHMNRRLADAPVVAKVSEIGNAFFALDPAAAAAILIGFTASLLLVAATLLARQSSETL
jgi:ABC-type multidrug transport system ATPase subunit/pSer/pThr/pTyr-binding forkhead associated (FHA) protein